MHIYIYICIYICIMDAHEQAASFDDIDTKVVCLSLRALCAWYVVDELW